MSKGHWNLERVRADAILIKASLATAPPSDPDELKRWQQTLFLADWVIVLIQERASAKGDG